MTKVWQGHSEAQCFNPQYLLYQCNTPTKTQFPRVVEEPCHMSCALAAASALKRVSWGTEALEWQPSDRAMRSPLARIVGFILMLLRSVYVLKIPVIQCLQPSTTILAPIRHYSSNTISIAPKRNRFTPSAPSVPIRAHPASCSESANFYASSCSKLGDSSAAAPVLMRRICLRRRSGAMGHGMPWVIMPGLNSWACWRPLGALGILIFSLTRDTQKRDHEQHLTYLGYLAPALN